MNPEEIKTEVQAKVDEAVAATMAKVDAGEITTAEDAVMDLTAGLEGEKKEEPQKSKLGGLGMENEGAMELGEEEGN